MKRLPLFRSAGFLVVLALLCCLKATAGDDVIPALSLFTVPKAALRASKSTNEIHMAALPPAGAEKPEQFTASSERAGGIPESSIQAFESMNAAPVLFQMIEPDKIGGAAGWVRDAIWDPVFAPEVIKIGHVKMTGGIIAAVKRRNPFCLLHPLVFAAGW